MRSLTVRIYLLVSLRAWFNFLSWRTLSLTTFMINLRLSSFVIHILTILLTATFLEIWVFCKAIWLLLLWKVLTLVFANVEIECYASFMSLSHHVLINDSFISLISAFHKLFDWSIIGLLSENIQLVVAASCNPIWSRG